MNKVAKMWSRVGQRKSGQLRRFGLGSIVALLGLVAIVSPFASPASSTELVGVLLLLGGSIEVLHSLRLVGQKARNAAYVSGGITFSMGLLTMAAPFFVESGLRLFLVGSLLLDGCQKLWSLRRERQNLLSAVGSALASFLLGSLLLWWRFSVELMLALIGGSRLVSDGLEMLSKPVHQDRDAGRTLKEDLELPDNPEIEALCDRISLEEITTRGNDRLWIFSLLVTLFAIHVGRMQSDWTLLAMAAPFFAVLGDCLVALALTLGVFVPGFTMAQKLGRPLEATLWRFAYTDSAPSILTNLTRILLSWRLRVAIRVRQANYSFPMALERALGVGLPFSAILAATVPVWGMNWYFDTENWASGAYDSWAAHRTIVWRETMVRATTSSEASPFAADSFRLEPGNLDGDFSFLVIGDTGEGDASQLSLKDQLLLAGQKAEVRFLVLSSDVIYPSGSIVDYEHKFFLPFKGFHKPIYAIPGNHDWYDALDGFSSVFFQPEAARKAMRARVEEDQKLTSTTDTRIESLLKTADRLRELYHIDTGHQKAPYFQIQTDTFALIALDTGVLRRLDPDQLVWLKRALANAEDKFKMVILGHPFYAGGRATGQKDEEFQKIYRLLRQHRVQVVMAGDTHDFEYYKEKDSGIHHFVNGGGGAYLSYGTALSWPEKAALPEWAHYPTRNDVTEKITETIPAWKKPLWFWTRYADAWPFSAEWLSAAFDSNTAPFYQSFVEVKVSPSKNECRILVWGVDGPLKWGDLKHSLNPSSHLNDEPAEFIIPMGDLEKSL